MTALALQNSFSALVSLGSYRVGLALTKSNESDEPQAEVSATPGGRTGQNLARAAQGSESPILTVERSIEVIPTQTVAAIAPPTRPSVTYRPSHVSRGRAFLLQTNEPKGQFIDERI